MIVIMNKKAFRALITLLVTITIIVVVIIIYNNKNVQSVSSHYNNVNKPIERGNPNSNYIALACNVDWGNESLLEMLEILRQKDIKITFFVTGRWIKNFPDLFEKIVKEEHEIGSHGYNHLDYSKLSLEENKNQIKQTEEEILKYMDKKPTLFSPPSGAYNQYTLMAAQELGYKTILWSIDTIDWRQDSTKDVIFKRVMDKLDHNGAIILMHPMPETVKALPLIIDELKRKNLKIGRVSDVLID